MATSNDMFTVSMETLASFSMLSSVVLFNVYLLTREKILPYFGCSHSGH